MVTIIVISVILMTYGVGSFLLGWRLGAKTEREIFRAELNTCMKRGFSPEAWFDAPEESGVRTNDQQEDAARSA